MVMLPLVNTVLLFLMAVFKLSPTMLPMITQDTLPMFNTLVKLSMLKPGTKLVPNSHMLVDI